jgi:DNA-binding MarR family transcriptional regulator
LLNTGRRTGVRAQAAQELLQLMPALKRTFQASIPAELREELAHVTTHQLEALGLLLQLRGHEGGATMHEVAQMQGCALSTATALADRLIRQGLAARAADAEDRRVVKIVPTARARALLEKFIASRRVAALAAIEPLSDEEAAMLVDLLRKMAGSQPEACAPWRGTDAHHEEAAHG